MPDILDAYRNNAVKARIRLDSVSEEVGSWTGAGIKSFQDKPTWGSMIKGAVGGIARRMAVGKLDGSPQSFQKVLQYLQARSQQWEGNPQDPKPSREFAGMLDAISRKGYMNNPQFADQVKQLKLWQAVSGDKSGAAASKQFKKLKMLYDRHEASEFERQREEARKTFQELWIDIEDELTPDQNNQIQALWNRMTGKAAPTAGKGQQQVGQQKYDLSTLSDEQKQDLMSLMK